MKISPSPATEYEAPPARMAVIELRVIPNAPHDQIVGRQGSALKVKLCVPGTDGKANLALIQFLADALHVKSRHLVLLSGAGLPEKRIALFGLDAGEVEERIDAMVAKAA